MKPVGHSIRNILFLGDSGTGKTSFIDCLCKRERPSISTISERYNCIVITTGATTDGIPLSLYDVNDNDLSSVGTFGASAAFIFFDVTRLSTLDGAKKWKKYLDSNISNIPTILLANKVDLSEGTVWKGCLNMEAFCKEYGFSTWFEISVKEGNTTEAFGEIIKLIGAKKDSENDELRKKVALLEEENARLRKEIDVMEKSLGIKGDEKW